MVFSDTEQVYYGVSVRRYSGAYDTRIKTE